MGLADVKKSTYVFIGVAGLLAYLTNAALSAIFIVAVPMASDWCLEYEETSTDSDNYKVPECVLFKDDFEEKSIITTGG